MIPCVLQKGSSGVGLSYYSHLMDCPFRATLNAQRKALGLPGAMSIPQAEGFLMHALMDLYETERLPRDAPLNMVSYDPSDHPAVRAPGAVREAARLMEWWRLLHPPGYFGLLFSMEESLNASPELCARLGVPELTGRTDQVVTIDEFTAAKLQKERMIDLEPGAYLIDLKCLGRRGFNRYILGFQSTAYFMMWSEAHPEIELKGMLLHFLVKTKTPDSILYHIPPPDEEAIGTLRNALAIAQRWKSTVGPLQKNPWACVDAYDGVCGYWESGDCDRHS